MENSETELAKFYELSFYTLAHPNKQYFIHQHIVDAFQAQTADQNTKPIGLIFSLVGLYLFIEKNYSGRQVQEAHMVMARKKKAWPKIELPNQRGGITIENVLETTAGELRDQMIKRWCISVWEAYQKNHTTIAMLVNTELGKQ